MRNQKGITLLEAVLGMMIMSVGLLGVYPMMQTATASAMSGNYKIVGLNLADFKMENILADKEFRGYNWVTTDKYALEQVRADGTICPAQGSLQGCYERSAIITEVNQTDLTTAQAGTGYKKIDVTVSWGSQTFERLTISTLLTNY